jgi:uncharacterized protein
MNWWFSDPTKFAKPKNDGAALLPEADLPLRIIGNSAYFDFLGPQDEPWVQSLLGEMQRFEGQRRRQLAERLAEPLSFNAPYFKRRAASRILMRLWKPEKLVGVRPTVLREAVFSAAALHEDRQDVLDAAALSFSLSRQALAETLFGDLPGERIVRAPCPVPLAHEVVLRTNLAIAQAAVMRASTIALNIQGATRPIVRLAKLRGLLCVVKEATAGAPPLLEISGPFALFRHTLIYGRALAELLPHLAWCARFTLNAQCSLRGRLCDVSIDNSAPIFPADAPATFDSKLEARFAKDIAALALDWDLLREPEPLQASGTLIFPDFLLTHRIHKERRVFIELIGFWTPEYLTKKLARLRDSGIANIVLCLDEDRLCNADELPPGLPIVKYRRRVDAAAVMEQVERLV